MPSFYRVATFMLAVAPVIAQTAPQQAKPAPQAAPPASAQTASPAPAAKAPAANSQRYVTNDNFYRPGVKPQPGTPASSATTPAASKPAATEVPKPGAIKPNILPTIAQPVAQPATPVVTPAPAARALPTLPMQPAVIAAPAPASGSATPAAVDYVAGKLTVVADNAPLGFVLNLIAAKTGAVIDLVPELQNEPVVARLGPASVREVMSALLDSPRIDYIVLGAGDETGALQRVVVRTRHSMGLFAMSAPRAPQPKQEEAAEEETLDQDGHLVSNGRTPTQAQQRMQNWQRSREAMRAAEIKQQAQERENDRNGSPDPPAPPQNNPPDPPQNQPENPPQF